MDQAAAGSIVMRRGERKTGIILERINGLNQTFSEGSLTEDPSAVMILQRAGNDFRSRGRSPINQNH